MFKIQFYSMVKQIMGMLAGLMLIGCVVIDEADAQFGSGTYTLVFKHSGKCLDVSNRSMENGARVQQYECHGGDNQLVELISRGQGYYMIRFLHSQKCVDVPNRNGNNNVGIEQYQCNGIDNQLVKLIPTGGGYYRMVFAHSGKCLDVGQFNRSNGAAVLQFQCNEGENQQFRLNRQSSKGQNYRREEDREGNTDQYSQWAIESCRNYLRNQIQDFRKVPDSGIFLHPEYSEGRNQIISWKVKWDYYRASGSCTVDKRNGQIVDFKTNQGR